MSINNTNTTEQDTVTSPISMLYRWESEHPDTLYMTQPINGKYIEFTWKEAITQARKVAAALRASDYPKGSKIAILSKNCAHWIIADMGIAMAGHVSVPIFATAGKDTIQYVLAHAECPLIFVGKLDEPEASISYLPDNVKQVAFPYEGAEVPVSWEEFTDIEPIADNPVPDMDDIFSIIYTSGSTGQPKGVVHTYRTLSWAASHSIHVLGVSTKDRVMSYLPLAHITERALIQLSGYYSGMKLYFVESLDTFTRDVKNCDPTLFVSVPRLWTKFQMGILSKVSQKKLNFLLRLPIVGKKVASQIRKQLGLDSARHYASGSAPLAPATIDWFSKLGINICEAWGMTENAAYGTSCIPFRQDKVGSIGKAYDGVDMRIADDGEIQVKAPCNMIGYYKDQEKTSGVFTNDGYLRTGDKGVVDSDGYYRITGRLKDIFKTAKGKYVTPAPIEAKIMENSSVEQVCVTGTNLAQPIGLLVLSDDAKKESQTTNEASLLRTLETVNQTLESHQRLDRLIVFSEEWSVDNDLLTPTLKVKRHTIEDTFADIIAAPHSDKIVWTN
ncbi:AMP-dependent synthetase [Thalassotalea euphylliae]|uniref:AMP-dependent synthetase n=1 Tax=Thalassotalea euphylliae TaxID=1655234 RepID=A0A3E0TPA4_9GAMM|nr:AMP-binding protein [Thalassotalea euphylliae]REL26354.1 AMP-dependent synthetase [Thalassotalea euphylliae]